MSKDAKFLLVSLGIFFVLCIVVIYNSQYECKTVEYQNLNGTQTAQACHFKKDKNCWDLYTTENEAIKMCEK